MKSIKSFIATLLLLHIQPGTSYIQDFDLSELTPYPSDPVTPKTWQHKIPVKYEQWYPGFKGKFEVTSNEVCNWTHEAYLGSPVAREELGPIDGYCRAHMKCIMGSIDEYIKADMAAASVLLGLTPTLLAGLGPSGGEISLLSLHRPLLAFLVSLGSSAIYPSRLFSYENPFNLIKPSSGALIVPRIRNSYAAVISVAQYVFAIIAVLNLGHVSYILGVKTILVWGCDFNSGPLTWSICVVAVHAVACISLRIALWDAKGPTRSFKQFWVHEFQICANGKERFSFKNVRLGPLGIGLNFFTGLLGFCHIVFGTAVFSSLLFIRIDEAIFQVLRFLLSCMICRLILYFEIAGMTKLKDGREASRWIVQDAPDSGIASGFTFPPPNPGLEQKNNDSVYHLVERNEQI